MSALLKYGIPQVLDISALIAARKVLGELVNGLTSSTETSAKIQSEMIKVAAENPDNRKVAEDLVSELIGRVSDLVNEDASVSAAIYEILRDKLVPYVKDERDFWTLTTSRAQRNANRTTDNTDEIKSDFDEIRTFAVALFTTLSSMGLFAPDEGFPTKVNKAKAIVPDLPMLPRGGGSKDGKATKVRKVRWSIDGEELPSDTLPQEVIRKLYSVEERRTMTVTAFFDLLGADVYTPEGVIYMLGKGHAPYEVKGWTPKAEGDDETDSEDNEPDPSNPDLSGEMEMAVEVE